MPYGMHSVSSGRSDYKMFKSPSTSRQLHSTREPSAVATTGRQVLRKREAALRASTSRETRRQSSQRGEPPHEAGSPTHCLGNPRKALRKGNALPPLLPISQFPITLLAYVC
jgi:hypothetical protein